MVELVDAPDSKSGSARSVGSIPTARTTILDIDLTELAPHPAVGAALRRLMFLDHALTMRYAEVCNNMHERSFAMANVERVTVTVSAEQAAILRHTVEDGEYASTSEIVREALRDWTRKRDNELRDLEVLRAAIREGLDSGPGIPAKEVFAELRARFAHKD